TGFSRGFGAAAGAGGACGGAGGSESSSGCAGGPARNGATARVTLVQSSRSFRLSLRSDRPDVSRLIARGPLLPAAGSALPAPIARVACPLLPARAFQPRLL